jgi:maltoporin
LKCFAFDNYYKTILMKQPSKFLTKVKMGMLFAGALVLSSNPLLAASLDTQAPATSIEDLRKEFQAQIDSMQSAYEKRIATLEERLSYVNTAETKDEVIQRLEIASVKAEVAAQRAEEAYSSTIAASQIAALAKEGNTTGWRDLSDYTKGFEFHGMMRTNFGVTGNGGPLEEFQAPLAGGWYTLGNRNDTYGELRFVNHFLQDDLRQEGVRFRAETLIAYATNKAFADGGKKTDKFSARQVFAEAEGLMRTNPEAKLWAGQRYYLNYGFPINNADIMNYGGYGLGLMDYALPDERFGKLSLAYIGGTFDGLTPDGEVPENPTYAKNNLVLSLDDVPLPYGKGLFFVTLAGSKGRNKPYITKIGGDLVRADRYASTGGVAVGAIHTATDFFGGYNQLGITFGKGAASNMSAVVDDPIAQVNKSWSVMLSESFTIQPYQNFSVAFVALAQFAKRGDVTFDKNNNLGTAEVPVYKATGADMKKFRWFSVGVQPVFHVNKYVDLAFEGAVDWVNTKLTGGAKGALLKGTIALEVSPSWSFTAKPVGRIFATAATWGDGLRGLVGGDTYANNKGGYSLGASVEASW